MSDLRLVLDDIEILLDNLDADRGSLQQTTAKHLVNTASSGTNSGASIHKFGRFPG